MERVERRGICLIEYHRGDRVKVGISGEAVCGTVVEPGQHDGVTWASYLVKIDGGFTIKTSRHAIIKQADNGGMGRIHHMEEF